jgi:hypothetical protein
VEVSFEHSNEISSSTNVGSILGRLAAGGLLSLLNDVSCNYLSIILRVLRIIAVVSEGSFKHTRSSEHSSCWYKYLI